MLQGPKTDLPAKGTEVETAALGLGVIWVVAVALAFWATPAEGLGLLRVAVMLLAIVVPLGFGLLALALMRANRAMRAEIARLEAQMTRPAPAPAPTPAPVRAAAAPLQPISPPRNLHRPAPVQKRPAPAEQPKLALVSSGDDQPPLARGDLVHALNFPDSADDTAGFAALRCALRDPVARHLVQASQDVLTLLSQDGIYMDDLRPADADCALWRRFAKGERGAAMAAVGAVIDEDALAKVTARMREDTVFRDAVHHFLRRFDLVLMGFEPEASDDEITALAATRTARAFMLLARASRVFD
jgi:hypothetical protein